jgi:hypothetical protein
MIDILYICGCELILLFGSVGKLAVVIALNVYRVRFRSVEFEDG